MTPHTAWPLQTLIVHTIYNDFDLTYSVKIHPSPMHGLHLYTIHGIHAILYTIIYYPISLEKPRPIFLKLICLNYSTTKLGALFQSFLHTCYIHLLNQC